MDLNHRPLGYEPNELPDCSTPQKNHITAKGDATVSPASVLLCPVLLHFGNGGTVCRSFPHRPLVINLGFLGFGALSGLCRARPFLLDEALRPSAYASFKTGATGVFRTFPREVVPSLYNEAGT